MKQTQTTNISNLSDELICALIARDQLRKQGRTIVSSTALFSDLFHEWADVRKGKNDKHAAELEKQRKVSIRQYVDAHLVLKDVDGNPTETVVVE